MPSKSSLDSDHRLMAEALGLGRQCLGLTTPNPAVGCVIVANGRVVGRGATAPGGRPHAETIALAAAGKRARGATAYVSFEPCAHRGKTSSCARALAESGIRRVVVGCLDPYPPVRGRGLKIMRRAGIAVTTGVMEEECRRLNEGFITRVTRRRPFVILKLAASLDGRIAAPGGDSRWISSAASRALVHQWRSECDAVMVGARTVIADDPRLTCRSAGGRDPIRVIVDARLRVPPSARVFRGRSRAGALLVTSPANLDDGRRRYASPRVEVIAVTAHGDELALDELMSELARRGWCKVMIEGGAVTAASALRHGVVDRIALFVAPLILGAGLSAVEGLRTGRIREALAVDDLSARKVGSDWLLEGRLRSRGRGRAPARADEASRLETKRDR